MFFGFFLSHILLPLSLSFRNLGQIFQFALIAQFLVCVIVKLATKSWGTGGRGKHSCCDRLARGLHMWVSLALALSLSLSLSLSFSLSLRSPFIDNRYLLVWPELWLLRSVTRNGSSTPALSNWTTLLTSERERERERRKNGKWQC